MKLGSYVPPYYILVIVNNCNSTKLPYAAEYSANHDLRLTVYGV